MRYWDLIIWSMDQDFIDKISDQYDVDYYDSDIYVDEEWEIQGVLANQLINYILTEAVNNLEVSDDIKEYLHSKIYLNCIDSWFDLWSEDVEDMIDWTDKEKQIIKDFLDL